MELKGKFGNEDKKKRVGERREGAIKKSGEIAS